MSLLQAVLIQTTQQDILPEATTIGANAAGCYINGQLLIPKDGINGISGYPVYGLTTGAFRFVH